MVLVMMLSRLNRATGLLAACCVCVRSTLRYCHCNETESTEKLCGLKRLWCFLFWFMLLLHVPSVTWTSMMVFLLGPYTEDGKLVGYEGLECDPRFWKVTFRLMIALIAYDTIIIIFLLAEGVKGLCSALRCCCCCCNRSDDSNQDSTNNESPEVDFLKTSQEILV